MNRNFDPRAWHTRGYLRHFDPGSNVQFITFRLADSMPKNVLESWQTELDSGAITDADLRRRIELYLDQGYGSAALKDKRVAILVRDTLLKWNGERYSLIAWVIMLNHVHLLLRNFDEYKISDIMHSIKSYTAHEANKILGKSGPFWFKEYFDRYIRNEEHFFATIKYIEENPVKARLCSTAKDWEFSSAYLDEE